MKTIAGYSIVEYQAPEDWAGQDIILPSQAKMRSILRSQESKTLSVDDDIPDIYRYGLLVSGDLEVPEG